MKDLNIPEIKAQSEALVLAAGGAVCDWLPFIEETTPRTQPELAARALILNALINIKFGAPIPIIKNWITTNGLNAHLSQSERELLEKRNQDLTPQEIADLAWSVEALWALIWAGGLTPDLPIDTHVPDTLATMVPNLQKNESGEKLIHAMRLRPYTELYPMRDLYYRAHWSARNAQLHGGPVGQISIDIIMERRKALEWLLDAESDWDDTNAST